MDRADSLAIFAEVAERGSFAEAARRLGRSPAAVTRAIAELESAARRPAAQPHHPRGQPDRGGTAVAGRRQARARRSRRDRAGRRRRRARRRAASCASPRRSCSGGCTSRRWCRVPRPLSRRVGGADAARSSGRSGRGGLRRRGTHRRAGGELGDRHPRRRDAPGRGRVAGLSGAPRHAAGAGRCLPRIRSSRSPGCLAPSAGPFATGGEIERCDQAAAHREHRGGGGRCGADGFRHHARAGLPGRRGYRPRHIACGC